jgi:tetratricopeptide (TPR) repeat protein
MPTRNFKQDSFEVIAHEFTPYKHPEYTTLELSKDLAFYKREVGLLDELSLLFKDDSNFMSYNSSHGGFVPIKTTHYTNKYIYLDESSIHWNNVNTNIKNHNSNVKIIKDISEFEQVEFDVLYIENGSNLDNESGNFIKSYIMKNNPIVLTEYNDITDITLNNFYILKFMDKYLYIPLNLKDAFTHEFWYWIKNNDNDTNLPTLDFNNLVNLLIMCKDSGPMFREILEKNLHYIDRYTIFDTGSSDGTQEIIKDVMKSKKGAVYEELFINFRDSRNRCIELAGTTCEFHVFLDDSYIMCGNIRPMLTLLRDDNFGDSYSVKIHSSKHDLMYGSNRITKPALGLKYKYLIHEVIGPENNKNVSIPYHEMHIEDYYSDYMENRTKERKLSDMALLLQGEREEPDDPRYLYYIAQTYTELKDWQKAFEYFTKRINHPKEGFIDEKNDCYYERAAIAEVYLNMDWAICHQYYLQHYIADPSRTEALCCIGDHYFRHGMPHVAFMYFKQAYTVKMPENAEISVRKKIYLYHTPKFLTQLAYQFGEYELGLECAQRVLSYSPEYEIESWLNIYKLLVESNNYQKSNQIVVKNLKVLWDKPNPKSTILFVANGGFKKWSGDTLSKEGLGGSETYIIDFAQEFTRKGYNVCVLCNCETNKVVNGVIYININQLVQIINSYKIDICYISRFSEYIPFISKHIEKTYFVLHDILPSGNVIPYNQNLKKIFCLSEWHKQYFLSSFPQLTKITTVSSNGIDLSRFQTDKPTQKTSHSFIYSSFPNRGLLPLLRNFPKIVAKYPDAFLNVFCDLSNEYMQAIAKDEMIEIQKLLDAQKTSVKNHGFVPKHVLDKYWTESEIWLYPCTFKETFCITALEAAASKTLAITTNLAALNETVADRGIMLGGDPNSEGWWLICLKNIENVFEGVIDKNTYLEKNYEWSLTKSYDKIAVDMEALF